MKKNEVVTKLPVVTLVSTILFLTIFHLLTRNLSLPTLVLRYTQNLHRVGHNIPTYWLFYVIFSAFLFFPGYAIIHHFSRLKKMTIGLSSHLAFAPLVSICLMFFLSIVFLLTQNLFMLLLFIPILVVSFVYSLLKKSHQLSKLSPYLPVFLVALFTIFITISREDFLYELDDKGYRLDTSPEVPITGYTGYDADNTAPWRIARFYYSTQSLTSPYAQEMLQDIVIYERTPLFPLVTTIIINIFGKSHFVYQRFLEVLAAFYFFSLFYLIKSFSHSLRRTWLIYLLILSNVQLSLMSYSAELYYKYLAAIPVILATALLAKKPTSKILTLQFLLLALAFLIHPYTIILSLAFILAYLLKDKVNLKKITSLTIRLLPLAILIVAWYLSSHLIKLPDSFNRTENLYFKNNLNTTDFIKAKAINLVQLFIPNPHQQSLDPTIPLTDRQSKFQFLRYSLISSLTPMVFLSTLVSIFRRRIKSKTLVLQQIAWFTPLVFWLIYLNQYSQRFDYGGTYFLLYHFVIPLFLVHIFVNLKSKTMLALLVFSYVLWMTLVFFFMGDPFTTPAMSATTASILSSFQIVLFIIICLACLVIPFSKKLYRPRNI
jgi:hypothetical protein